LASFKTYLESDGVGINDFATLQYYYGVTPMVWRDWGDGTYLAVNPSKAYETIGEFMGSTGVSLNAWDELLDNQDLLDNQYELVHGAWPQAYNEVVLIVDENNCLTDLALYSLGLRSQEDLEKVLAGETVEVDPNERFSYEDLVGIKLTLLLAADRYQLNDPNNLSSGCTDIADNEQQLFTALAHKGVELKISGVIRVNPDATAVSASGIIGYTSALPQHLLRAAADSDVGKAQLANPDIDVITGKLFPNKDESEAQKVENLMNYLSTLSTEERASWYVSQLPTLVLFDLVSKEAEGIITDARYPDNADGLANLQADIRTALESDPALLEMLGNMYGYDMSNLSDTYKKIVIGMIVAGCADYASAVQMMGAIRAMPAYETTLTVKMGTIMMLPTAEAKVADMEAYLEALPVLAKATLWDQVNPGLSDSTYAYNCRLLGIADPNVPSRIDIYPKSFDAKEEITALIDAYNKAHPNGGEVVYTDYIGVMLSSISVILDVITYVLVGFVAISLVVSSIMIGIITYISVLERIKEIGILRAIGASKRDVSSVFLAESMIVGFGAGLIGILMTLLLCLPINLIIRHLSGFQNLGAELPFVGAVALVVISVLLTLVAGAIPASIAAKREPVEALRSE
jgi:putative ABC transport system permease protein